MLSRPRWTLSRKLILALLVMVAVPFLVVQTFYYWQRYDRDRFDAVDTDREIAEAAALAIETRLSERARTQEAAGMAVLRMSLSSQEAAAYLSSLKKIDETVSEIYMIQPNGVVWTASDPSFVGLSVVDRSYYTDLVRGKDWTVSEQLQAKVDGGNIVVVSSAIRGDKGDLLWIIASGIKPTSLEHVGSIKLSGQRRLLMIDSAGMLVEPTDKPVLTPTQRRFTDVPAIAGALAGSPQLVMSYTSPGGGVRRMGAFVPVPTIGWVVSVTEPVDEALSQARQGVMESILVLLLLTLAASGAAWILARHMTRPLTSLREAALALGSGDLTKRAPVLMRDEVGDLAASFNAMAERIEERTAENERRLRELSVLEEIGGMLVGHAGLQQTLDAVAELVKKLSGASEVIVWLAIDNGEQMEACSAASDEGHHASQKLGFLIGRRHGSVFRKHSLAELLIFTDVESDERLGSSIRKAILDSGLRSMIWLPLVVRDYPVGIISVAYAERTRIPDSDLSKYRILADQVAIAVENARLYDRLSDQLSMRGDEVRSLHTAAQAVASTLEPSEVQETLVRVTRELFQAQAVWLHLFNPRTQLLEVGAQVGLGAESATLLSFSPGQGVVGEAFATQKPIFVPDLWLDERTVHPDHVRAVNLRAILCSPILSKGQSLGVLGIATTWMSEDTPPSQAQIDALVSLASHAAIAIENAQLYDQMTQSNKALATNARRLETVLEVMPAGVLIVDGRSGIVTAVNRTAIALLGHSVYRGMPFLERIWPKILDRAGREIPMDDLPLARSVRHGETCHGIELVLESHGQRRVTVLANTAPLFDAEGRLVGAVSVFQDIERLKAADRLKDEFVSLVSHELRTPLTAIKAYATSLLQKDLHWPRHDRDRFLGVIVQECNHLTRIVQSLLDLSAIEAGSLRIERHWRDLGELMEIAVERLNGVLAGHRLHLDIEPNLPPVAVDYTRFQQVVANLLENAAKYSPPASTISVSCKVEGDQVMISVQDEGPGVPPEYRERIFEKFFRGEKTTWGGNKGVGLGLAICKGFVEAHGGAIRVSSNNGHGAAFTVSLPLTAASEDIGEVQ